MISTLILLQNKRKFEYLCENESNLAKIIQELQRYHSQKLESMIRINGLMTISKLYFNTSVKIFN